MRTLVNTLFFFLLLSQICFGQWVLTNGPYERIYCFAVAGTNLFAGTYYDGIFISTNNGTDWTAVNDGLMFGMYGPSVRTLAVSGTSLFAGANSGIWRRPLAEMITSIDNEPTQPTDFILNQNYPNPFNPSTKITFPIPERSNTTIKVYNTVGSEVATLLNEVKQPGTYEVEFNAAELSSGAYFYSIETYNFREVKKMILLR